MSNKSKLYLTGVGSGSTGPAGPTGATGAGTQGAQGAAGSAGSQGAQGAQGSQGGGSSGTNITLYAESGFYAATSQPAFNVIQGTNSPVPGASFVVGNVEYWRFPVNNYTSGNWTVLVSWYATATTNKVKWEVAMGAITIGTDTGSMEAKAFATATSVESTVNSNANAGNVTSITISGGLDAVASGDWVQFYVKRIASSSEMSGGAIFQYAALSWS